MKKKKPKRTPIPAVEDPGPEPVQVAKRETDPAKNPQARDRVRREAAILFCTDPEGLTVADLHEDPRFRHIPLKTLQQWCTADGWVERRQSIFDNWRRQVEDRLGSEMAKGRIQEIRELHKIRRMALQKLEGPDVQVKSWEGVVRSLLEVNERLEQLATSVSKELLPGQPHGAIGGQGAMRSDLSIDEVRAATKEILRLRRESIRRGAQLGSVGLPGFDVLDDPEAMPDVTEE